MSDVIIFVDDASPESPFYITGDICQSIASISNANGEPIRTIEISGEGLLLSKSLPLIKKVINEKIDLQKEAIRGICLDLVDDSEREETQKVRSGIALARAIKSDQEISTYQIIIYTSKYPPISKEDKEFLENAKIKIVRRENSHRKGEKTVFDIMAENILRALQ